MTYKKPKKPRLAKKTVEKLKWLEENHKKYIYRDDIIKALCDKFGIIEKHGLRVWGVYQGEIENTGSWRKATKSLISDNCYFCEKTQNLVNHHWSYTPERIVTLCKSCHNKIHTIMDKQHKLEKRRLKQFEELQKWVENSRPYFRADFVEK